MTRPHPSEEIAVIGGTGALGRGLALRWGAAGHEVTVGSREANRAVAAAQALSEETGRRYAGAENAEAARRASIVVLAIPYLSHAAILQSVRPYLSGKILIDTTVPLRPPKVRTVHLPEGGSVAKATQALLGDEVRVVSAFQNVAAGHLAQLDHEIDCDILVCGNDPEARSRVVALAADAGMRGWHAGRIDNSSVAEGLTSALIFINRHYDIPGAGIRVTGTPSSRDRASAYS